MYQKEIIYMGLYKGGSRMGSAGFVKVENRDQSSRLCLNIRNIPLGISGRFPIRIYNGSGWKELNGVAIQDGSGSWENRLEENVDRTMIQVILPGGYLLEGKSKSAPETVTAQSTDTPDNLHEPDRAGIWSETDIRQDTNIQNQNEPSEESRQEAERELWQGAERESRQEQEREPDNTSEQEEIKKPETIIVKEELPRPAFEKIDEMPECVPDYNLKEDKWEQILDTYEQIHPYGDERVYVKLEPKDFVILRSQYQHLVNNSFLLHGFYNYRYVILGKEQDYYLGVPGVFYEREKMVALMFGFEAFECPGGNVRAGEFGYYLRKVEL